jgi:mono/diheme cytochrome c family protein
MSRMLTVAAMGLALCAAEPLRVVTVHAAGQAGSKTAATSSQATAANQRPPDRALLDQYCVTCHNDRLKTGGLSLDKVDVGDTRANAEVLEKVIRKLRTGQMPPMGRPRPDEAAIDAFAGSMETQLDRAAAQTPNAGRVASHRLNRGEYVNAIHDMLALDINGAELLPGDMAGFGFDNNADVLAITPGLMSRYISAATKISRLAIGSPENRPIMQVYKLGFERRDARAGEELPFATHGGLAVHHVFPLDGEYVFTIKLKRNGTVSSIDGIEEDEHQIEIRVDHALIKRFTIGGKFPGPDPGTLIAPPEDDLEGRRLHDYRVNADKDLELRLPIKAGERLVSVAFTDSAPSALENVRSARSGALPGVDMLYIGGPFNGTTPQETPSRQAIFSCRPRSGVEEEPCARKIISTLEKRAYRRPVTDRDIEPLLAIYKEGRAATNFDGGIERAIEALLSSPKFLIRVEREPADVRPGTVYRLSDLELATRLSFFLWKSGPDDELIDIAARGALKEPAVLAKQVNRMLADPRATRFMNDFAEQWLQIRNISSLDPNGALFPGFDDTLRKAMARETELFFESQVRGDRPIPELLRANYSFLNEQLAQHYGIDNIYGSHFRRVTLTDENRFGLLGHASILTITSYADRTSVVLRGKWVLENLLGAPPPPPPPNVPPLKENTPGAKPTALRERMEQHRASPVCSSCHARMDPLGFALEHFDAVGQFRANDRGATINSNITLDGKDIASPKEFREALLAAGHGREFVGNVVEKLMTYALGRGVTERDAPTVRELVRDLEKNDYRWSELVQQIVRSTPFQMRTAAGSETTATTTTATRGQ